MESTISGLWEDRTIKFDVPNLLNRLRGGEKVLLILYHIEDTKGNPGDNGKLIATNLRIIWHSLTHKKFNLCLGYGKLITMNTRTVFSKNRGTTQALYILANNTNMKFEFLFTDLSIENNTRKQPVFSNVFEIYKLYQETYLYREMKLRGSIVHGGHLIVLPHEKVFNVINGVWNLSSDQGNLGSFIITNIRLVWFADINEGFNLSLPYIQIEYIKIRDSKYGPALVLQTKSTGGCYVLGFRIDPAEKLNEIFKELTSLYSVYFESPDFGIYYESKKATDENEEQNTVDQFQEIDDQQEAEVNLKLNAYLAEGSSDDGQPSREPFYCKELGFSMEKLRDGYKLSDLWNVDPDDAAELKNSVDPDAENKI